MGLGVKPGAGHEGAAPRGQGGEGEEEAAHRNSIHSLGHPAGNANAACRGVGTRVCMSPTGGETEDRLLRLSKVGNAMPGNRAGLADCGLRHGGPGWTLI